jgi:hypothetical protein
MVATWYLGPNNVSTFMPPVFATISLAPVSLMQLSQGLRPPMMMTSPFIPVVSGNW